MSAQSVPVREWLTRQSWLFPLHWGRAVWYGGLTLTCLWSLSASPAFAQQPQQRPREEAAAPKETSPPPKPVKVTKVGTAPIERTTVALGSLAASDQATMSVKVPGRLRRITVDLGTIVKRGDVIAEIEPQDYHLRVQQAEAAVAQARVRLGLPPTGSDDKVELDKANAVRQARVLSDESKANRDRLATLHEQGVIPRVQLDTAEASYKVTLSRLDDAREEIHNRQAVLTQRRTELNMAQQQLADTTILAPFDGAVQEKRASVGEFLGAGAPLAILVRMDPLRLRAEVPEREAARVQVGQTVRVTTEGDPNVYTGRIARLSPTITPQNRMLMVEAEVTNRSGTLRPGSFARAEIVTDDRSMSVMVPTRAIVAFAGIEKVLLVKDGKIVEKPITTRRRNAEWTEVVDGLSAGEAVVTEPGNLQSGQAVAVVE